MSDPVYIHKKDGKWNAAALRIVMDGMPDGSYAVTIGKDLKKRSLSQNSYYWSTVVEIIRQALSTAWGERLSKQSTHEILRLKFLAEDKRIGDEGEVLTTIKSTTELDTIDMVEYTEQCRAFAEEYLGVTIPEPNSQMELEG